MAIFGDTDITTLTPSCVFLDYLLLCEKVTLGGEQVTVLPKTYSKQQAQLGIVVGKLTLPKLTSYTSVFYSLGSNTYEEVCA